jgi:lysozyme
MTRPKLPEQSARELVAPFRLTDKVMLLGIRGYYKRTMGDPTKNDRNIYDDAIFIISNNGYWAFNANTDPSTFKKGIATLLPGVYRYRKGKHGISRPGGGYPALRPATPGEKLPVYRDSTGESMGIALNIHKGGYKTTSSEGCQTIHPSQWDQFIKKVYELMDECNQSTIPYVLVEE